MPGRPGQPGYPQHKRLLHWVRPKWGNWGANTVAVGVLVSLAALSRPVAVGVSPGGQHGRDYVLIKTGGGVSWQVSHGWKNCLATGVLKVEVQGVT